jgi:hypothetical protein
VNPTLTLPCGFATPRIDILSRPELPSIFFIECPAHLTGYKIAIRIMQNRHPNVLIGGSSSDLAWILAKSMRE